MNISVIVSYPEVRPKLWRVKHDIEIGKLWRGGLPEVHPFYPNHFSRFGKYMQILSRNMNPRFLIGKWIAMYGSTTWIANGQGFGDESDPRANYISGKDLQFEDPKTECLTCGGNVVTGEMRGDWFHAQCLDFESAPTLEWILARPWLFTYAVNVDGFGNPRRFSQGEQPNGEVVPFIHPFIGMPRRYTEIVIERYKLQEWTSSELPDPYKVYL